MFNRIFIVSVCFMLQACTVTLVQPYDEKLLDGTEAYYKQVSQEIEKARIASPKTRNLADGQSPSSSSGHISHFKNMYSKFKIDANALIIRAVVNSYQVDSVAGTIHKKIEDFISSSFPSNCEGSNAMIEGQVTLTVQNYLDLKCLVVHWETQHIDAPNQILKKFYMGKQANVFYKYGYPIAESRIF